MRNLLPLWTQSAIQQQKTSTGSLGQRSEQGVLYLSMTIIASFLVLDLKKSLVFKKLLKLSCSEFSQNKREHQEDNTKYMGKWRFENMCVCISKKSNWRKLFPFPAYWKMKTRQKLNRALRTLTYPSKSLLEQFPLKTRSAHLVCLRVEPQQGDNIL